MRLNWMYVGAMWVCASVFHAGVIAADMPDVAEKADALITTAPVMPCAEVLLDIPPAVLKTDVVGGDASRSDGSHVSSSDENREAPEKGSAGNDNAVVASGKPVKDTAKEGAASEKSVTVPPLRLGLTDAVLSALRHNAAFSVERISPSIQKTYEADARAAFDPTLSGSISRVRKTTDEDVRNQFGNDVATAEAVESSLTVSEYLPTGTTLSGSIGFQTERQNNVASEFDSHGMTYDVTMTQSLLRGFGPKVNLVNLKQARLSSLSSAYELRGVAETLVADVESTYWDAILAERSIAIYERSLEIAELQIDEVRERVKIGDMAETEFAAAEAEVASRREELIDARSSLVTTRLKIIRLLNIGGADMWTRPLELTEAPDASTQGSLDAVEAHVSLGLKQRPDLNQAQLSLQKGELEIVRTRNGLLPKLDLFVRLGNTRYADSFSSMSDRDGHDREVSVGLQMEYALGHREERAAHTRAQLSLEQARMALVNMEQLVQVDIRSAYVEVERTMAQMTASTATRKLREESLRTEQEKFRVGKSTAILVSQAWRDLVASQIAEVRNQVDYRKALLDLYRLEGTLLERRGIRAEAE